MNVGVLKKVRVHTTSLPEKNAFIFGMVSEPPLYPRPSLPDNSRFKIQDSRFRNTVVSKPKLTKEIAAHSVYLIFRFRVRVRVRVRVSNYDTYLGFNFQRRLGMFRHRAGLRRGRRPRPPTGTIPHRFPTGSRGIYTPGSPIRDLGRCWRSGRCYDEISELHPAIDGGDALGVERR